ncbi:MAG: hypothetical protein JO060_01850, partial [Candidatus Eremiobacteraeota bacterium]|nr:hypothetical protein [Candidatus Eremiobacteraeota bacterium]
MKRAIAVVAAAILLVGCTKVGSTGEGTRHNRWTQPHVLRYADISDVSTLNPMFNT